MADIAINHFGTGAIVLLPGHVSRPIAVHRLMFTLVTEDPAAIVTGAFKAGATYLTGPMAMIYKPYSDVGVGWGVVDYTMSTPWFNVPAGQDFILELSAECQVSGMLNYALS